MRPEPIKPITIDEIKAALRYSRGPEVPEYGDAYTEVRASFTIHASVKVSTHLPPPEDHVRHALEEHILRRLYEDNTLAVCDAIDKVECAHPATPEFWDALKALRVAARYQKPVDKRN